MLPFASRLFGLYTIVFLVRLEFRVKRTFVWNDFRANLTFYDRIRTVCMCTLYVFFGFGFMDNIKLSFVLRFELKVIHPLEHTEILFPKVVKKQQPLWTDKTDPTIRNLVIHWFQAMNAEILSPHEAKPENSPRWTANEMEQCRTT